MFNNANFNLQMLPEYNTKKLKIRKTSDSIDKYVADRVRARRSEMGITQEELAEAIGITCQQVQKYEYSVNRISASRLYKISKALNVPVSYFYEIHCLEHVKETNLYCFTNNLEKSLADGESILLTKETRDLINTYFSIKSINKRKELLILIRKKLKNMAVCN